VDIVKCERGENEGRKEDEGGKGRGKVKKQEKKGGGVEGRDRQASGRNRRRYRRVSPDRVGHFRLYCEKVRVLVRLNGNRIIYLNGIKMPRWDFYNVRAYADFCFPRSDRAKANFAVKKNMI
jgi:hypothetical protein